MASSNNNKIFSVSIYKSTPKAFTTKNMPILNISVYYLEITMKDDSSASAQPGGGGHGTMAPPFDPNVLISRLSI